MNQIRSTILIFWAAGLLVVLGVVFLPTLLLPRAATLWAMRFYIRLLLLGLKWITGIAVEFRGLQHLPEGPLLVAGKHQATLDVFVPFLLFRDPIVVMKRELLWYPFLGWYALKSKMLPIDRDGGAQTVKKMLAVAKALVPKGKGRQMLIYPEGTRRLPGAEPDYKPAGTRAFYKALNLPLVPLATNSGLCWPAHGMTRRPGHVVYEILPPIEPGLPHKEMLARLEAELEAASERLLDEGLAVQGRTRDALQ
ncbi:MAG: lysophospholipid acyltransferase family protein [Henriciella sp.]|nr:lysophospholipid acyltransferase family protein [Henriciella sp.]